MKLETQYVHIPINEILFQDTDEDDLNEQLYAMSILVIAHELINAISWLAIEDRKENSETPPKTKFSTVAP